MKSLNSEDMNSDRSHPLKNNFVKDESTKVRANEDIIVSQRT